jgi:hypothetical protein
MNESNPFKESDPVNVLLENARMHLDGLLMAACELRDHHFELSYPDLLQRLQVISARVGALVVDLPASRLRDYVVLPFAVHGPQGAHAPEWLQSRPDPLIGNSEDQIINSVKEAINSEVQDQEALGTSRKRRRLGLGALQLSADSNQGKSASSISKEEELIQGLQV